jgi:hypothetical protein
MLRKVSPMDDLKKFALLSEPVRALGLPAATCDYLRGRRIKTVSDLLDAEWVLYPSAIADEIHAAVVAHQLLPPQASSDDTAGSPALSAEELAAREWSRIDRESETCDHVASFDTGGDVDWAVLTGSVRWREMRSLWIEHWFLAGAVHDDFRPWLRALAASPPPRLAGLVVGGYSGRSRDALVGEVEPALRALRTLDKLDLCGDLRGVGTVDAPGLAWLGLESGSWADADIERLFAAELPRLRELRLSIWEGDGDPLDLVRLGLLFAGTCPALAKVTIHGGVVTSGFFTAMAAAPGCRLASLDLSRAELPDDDAATDALIRALMDAREPLRGARLVLPLDADGYADRLAAAGLSCTFSD